MTVTTGGTGNEEEPEEQHTDVYRAVQEVRMLISDMMGPELPSIVEQALDRAEEASVMSSECRLAKPFAPIRQIGDTTGLYYECTHHPAHRF